MKIYWTPIRQKVIQNNLYFDIIYLTCWLDDKLENLSSLLEIYRIFHKSTKKKFTQKSTKNKG